jgi:esterase/lipase superfamily enzyme
MAFQVPEVDYRAFGYEPHYDNLPWKENYDAAKGHEERFRLNMVGKVRIKFKIEVIDNACLVARAAHLMTHGEFAEGYSLIRDMQGSDFLTALRMLAEQEVMVKKLSDFKEKHKGEKSESVAALLTRAAEEGDEEAISLLAAGALERRV